jgi:hypothetical protein
VTTPGWDSRIGPPFFTSHFDVDFSTSRPQSTPERHCVLCSGTCSRSCTVDSPRDSLWGRHANLVAAAAWYLIAGRVVWRWRRKVGRDWSERVRVFRCRRIWDGVMDSRSGSGNTGDLETMRYRQKTSESDQVATEQTKWSRSEVIARDRQYQCRCQLFFLVRDDACLIARTVDAPPAMMESRRRVCVVRDV